MTANEIEQMRYKLGRAVWILRAIAAAKPTVEGTMSTITIPTALLMAMDKVCEEVLPERKPKGESNG